MQEKTDGQTTSTLSIEELLKNYHVRGFNERGIDIGIKLKMNDKYSIIPNKKKSSLGLIVLFNGVSPPKEFPYEIRTSLNDETIVPLSDGYLVCMGHGWGRIACCEKYYDIREKWDYIVEEYWLER